MSVAINDLDIELIKSAFMSCPMGVAIYDLDYKFVYANEAFLELTKTKVSDIEQQKDLSLVHRNDIDNVQKRWEEALKKKPFKFAMTYRLTLLDKSTLWVHVKSSVLYNKEKVVGYLDMIQDQSDEKNYEEKIIAEIIESEDLERRRFAGELHDGLGQNLTAAFLNLETIRETINQLDNETKDKFNKGISFLNEAITETRSIAHNIMPKAIDDFGFVITVEGMIEGLKEVSDIEFTFYHNLEDGRINPTIEFNLYRITQEALNNVLKHSNAAQVTIQLLKHQNEVVLIIEDNGIGFDASRLDENLTDFGISSMRNRANSISATINIDSHSNKGTTITVEIPLS